MFSCNIKSLAVTDIAYPHSIAESSSTQYRRLIGGKISGFSSTAAALTSQQSEKLFCCYFPLLHITRKAGNQTIYITFGNSFYFLGKMFNKFFTFRDAWISFNPFRNSGTVAAQFEIFRKTGYCCFGMFKIAIFRLWKNMLIWQYDANSILKQKKCVKLMLLCSNGIMPKALDFRITCLSSRMLAGASPMRHRRQPQENKAKKPQKRKK